MKTVRLAPAPDAGNPALIKWLRTAVLALVQASVADDEGFPRSVITVDLGDYDDDAPTLTDGAKCRIPFGFMLKEVRASLSVEGGETTVDILVDGASILDDIITIEAGERTSQSAAVQPQISVGKYRIGDTSEVGFTTVGGAAAKGLKVYLLGNYMR